MIPLSGDPEADCAAQREGAGAGDCQVPAGPREGPGDPEAALRPGGQEAVRGHQSRPLLIPGGGGRPVAQQARSNGEGVPGADGQAGEREEGGRRSGGRGSAAER